MTAEKFVPEPIEAKLRIVSPIHIGTGEATNRAEIAAEGDIVYRTTLEELYKHYPRKEIEPLIIRQMERPTQPIPELKARVKRVPIYKMRSSEKQIDEGLEYYEHIKTKWKLYVPGSSIKGAIMTAMINKMIVELSENSQSFYDYIKNVVFKQLNRRDLNSAANRIIAITLMWINDPAQVESIKDFTNARNFRDALKPWIQVSDTESIKPEKGGAMRRISRLGRMDQPEKKRIPDVNMETLKQGIELKFEIQKHANSRFNIKQIMDMVDRHYREIFKDEMKWLKERGFAITTKEPQNDLKLIRIGKGSGTIGTSIIQAIRKLEMIYGEMGMFERYGKKWKLTRSGKTEPQTKWLARYKKSDGTKYYYYPLGWAAIKTE